jgi:hypothetical protein
VQIEGLCRLAEDHCERVLTLVEPPSRSGVSLVRVNRLVCLDLPRAVLYK